MMGELNVQYHVSEGQSFFSFSPTKTSPLIVFCILVLSSLYMLMLPRCVLHHYVYLCHLLLVPIFLTSSYSNCMERTVISAP